MTTKQLTSLLLLMGVALTSLAQITAVTEKGDTIYVYNDGTWTFTDDREQKADPIGLNFLNEELRVDTLEGSFTVSENAQKEVISRLGTFRLKYDDKNWNRVPAGTLNAEAEMAFKHKEKEIYAIIIAEEIEVGLENIVKIAVKNMKDRTGSDIQQHKTQLKTVNNVPLINGVYGISASGLELTFDSYYYSGKAGTIQFLSWTGSSLYPKYADIIEEFHNGLVIEPKEE
ncbi:MAG: hypothetical protein AAF990_10045 [Bacteroidota bacterium]